MKKLFTILAAILLTASVFAQAPQKMSYQAVIRNSTDVLVTNTQIGMEINIRQGSVSGTVVYTETQTPTTNANGLVSIEIGGGAGFNTIDWSAGPYFIETKTAVVAPLTTYTITGTSQLLSVPYALHAKTAETTTNPLWFTNTNGINADNLVGIGTSTPEANLHIKDNTGTPLIKLVSDDDVRMTLQSDRPNVDDYVIGIDGGNNRFFFANTTTVQYPLTFQGNKVGINQLNPQAGLDVVGSLKLTDGTQGNGKILRSDAQGNASWVSPTVADGSETKVTAGTNVTVTGAGTTASPYVVNASGAGTHYLGEEYLGGIIFYLYTDNTGTQKGLIVSKTEKSTATWSGSTLVNANKTSNGAYNMALMPTGAGTARTWVETLGAGWYLPSIDELSLLWHNRFHVNNSAASGLTLLSTTAYYWSSTEFDASYAFYFFFDAGNMTNGGKTSACSVRAVRAF